MINVLIVGIGGALGSIGRFSLGFLIGNFLNFPMATFIANFTGCFLIGVFEVFLPEGQIKYLLIPGFLGGFTTFSGFSNEFFKLINQGNNLVAVLYVSVTVILCLIAVVTGNYLAKLLH